MGGRKEHFLICKNDKICLPAALQERTVHWYHNQLVHPGVTRTKETIRQHFYWPKMDKMIENICLKCPICQITKQSYKKYGKLPAKEAETDPWDTLCVDLVGPYSFIHHPTKNKIKLWAVTMIDPATEWFEMAEIKDKFAYTMANTVEQTWFS